MSVVGHGQMDKTACGVIPGRGFFLKLLPILCSLLVLAGCHPRSCLLEPSICYAPQQKQFCTLPSPFPPLESDELSQDWGKELLVGIAFGRELDLYRAITAFKRALILMPQENGDRILQIQFYIVQAYYLGGKYQDAVDYFENSGLPSVPSTFPAFRELVIILYDAYREIGKCEQADAILKLIDKGDPETAEGLRVFSAVMEGDLSAAREFSCCRPDIEEGLDCFVTDYCRCKKSVRKAQTLNAVLPGAGYFYVGQKKTSVTSFFINLFTTAAAYYFFDQGNWGAGCFALSLEMGWYIGGINGAGLAAKEYNQTLYNARGKDFLIGNKLFPVLMIQKSF